VRAEKPLCLVSWASLLAAIGTPVAGLHLLQHRGLETSAGPSLSQHLEARTQLQTLRSSQLRGRVTKKECTAASGNAPLVEWDLRHNRSHSATTTEAALKRSHQIGLEALKPTGIYLPPGRSQPQ
jgi:hypothetical protein